MAYLEPARAATGRIPGIPLACLVVVSVAIAGALGYQVLASSSTIAPPIDVRSAPSKSPPPTDVLPRERRGALGEADGAVPDGTTVFDNDVPAVAKLDRALLGALRSVATDAAKSGVTFVVDSGWRSPEYQERLLQQAVSEYGSEEEAARWVASPNTSAHVSGRAVDIGPSGATAWLSRHGAIYGLCQIYRNEPWHYELRADAIRDRCPRMYADAAHDPRMQQ